MTPQMKAFLLELADLMEKHNVQSVEAVDDGEQYYPSVGGIEFCMNGDDNREECNTTVLKYFDSQELREDIKEGRIK